MFEDSLDVAHRISGLEHFGNQRALDRRPVQFEEAGAFPELFVCLPGTWRSAPDCDGMMVVLKDCPLGVADAIRLNNDLSMARYDQGQTTGPQSVGQDTFSAALFAGARPIQ